MREKERDIILGDEAEDTFTGFRGLVTGRAEYLSGHVDYQLQPRAGADGKWVEGQWFSAGRVRRVAEPVESSEEFGEVQEEELVEVHDHEEAKPKDDIHDVF